jgi:hypothetical protein
MMAVIRQKKAKMTTMKGQRKRLIDVHLCLGEYVELKDANDDLHRRRVKAHRRKEQIVVLLAHELGTVKSAALAPV